MTELQNLEVLNESNCTLAFDGYPDTLSEPQIKMTSSISEMDSRNVNPMVIKMKQSSPVKDKFISGIDMNIPKQDGFCVDEYLIKLMEIKSWNQKHVR